MDNKLFSKKVLDQVLANNGVNKIGKADIRVLGKVARDLENLTGIPIIHMEIGAPGLKSPQVGVEAEIRALQNDASSEYAPIEGVPILKKASERFIRHFLGLNFSQEFCIPTVGSMLANFITFMIAGHVNQNRNKILSIDPSFAVYRTQAKILGLEIEGFDLDQCHGGTALYKKLQEVLGEPKTCKYCCIVYSNPCNPTWECLSEEELEAIARISNEYDIIIAEDLAYFGMDFRKDYYNPGVPPYQHQPSVGNYTNNCIIMLSGSKTFSYAGGRIGVCCINPKLATRVYESLKTFCGHAEFWRAYTYGGVAPICSGPSNSAQQAFAAMLNAACDDGKFFEPLKEYAIKAQLMKAAFKDNGFHIVYSRDEDGEIADGFYFTYCYPGFTGEALVEEMLYYGVAGNSIASFGAKKQGIRACTSRIQREQIPVLAERLAAFAKDHPVN